MITVGERLKYLRTEILGISQQQVGNTLGITKAGISLIEKNQRRLTPKHIRILCEHYKINRDWLQYGIGNINSSDSEIAHEHNNSDITSEAIIDFVNSKATNINLILSYLKIYFEMTDEDISYLRDYISLTREEKNQVIEIIQKIKQGKLPYQ